MMATCQLDHVLEATLSSIDSWHLGEKRRRVIAKDLGVFQLEMAVKVRGCSATAVELGRAISALREFSVRRWRSTGGSAESRRKAVKLEAH